MKFDVNDLDFTPVGPSIDMLDSLAAEAAVVTAIVEGSGGPDNLEPTEAGLRFVRHLLSISGSARRGTLPNFKNINIIQNTARTFIRQCGGGSRALKVLACVTEG
jgi:hypothetical protein